MSFTLCELLYKGCSVSSPVRDPPPSSPPLDLSWQFTVLTPFVNNKSNGQHFSVDDIKTGANILCLGSSCGPNDNSDTITVYSEDHEQGVDLSYFGPCEGKKIYGPTLLFQCAATFSSSATPTPTWTPSAVSGRRGGGGGVCAHVRVVLPMGAILGTRFLQAEVDATSPREPTSRCCSRTHVHVP